MKSFKILFQFYLEIYTYTVFRWYKGYNKSLPNEGQGPYNYFEWALFILYRLSECIVRENYPDLDLKTLRDENVLQAHWSRFLRQAIAWFNLLIW